MNIRIGLLLGWICPFEVAHRVCNNKQMYIIILTVGIIILCDVVCIRRLLQLMRLTSQDLREHQLTSQDHQLVSLNCIVYISYYICLQNLVFHQDQNLVSLSICYTNTELYTYVNTLSFKHTYVTVSGTMYVCMYVMV